MKKNQKARPGGFSSPLSDEEEFSESDDSDIENYIKQNRIPKNSWIIKPGENTNRGNGIEVCKSL